MPTIPLDFLPSRIRSAIIRSLKEKEKKKGIGRPQANKQTNIPLSRFPVYHYAPSSPSSSRTYYSTGRSLTSQPPPPPFSPSDTLPILYPSPLHSIYIHIFISKTHNTHNYQHPFSPQIPSVCAFFPSLLQTSSIHYLPLTKSSIFRQDSLLGRPPLNGAVCVD